MSVVWRMTVRLKGVMPVVWRTMLVRPETKLAMLHRYIQAAMGWEEMHLYAFEIAGREYGIPDRDHDFGRKIYDARRYTLERLVPALPARFGYLYDFGDGWKHDIDIEGAEEAVYRKQYPICVDGGEPCPPEDVGGPPGYRDFLRVMSDPNDPEHEHFKAWAGDLRGRDFWNQRATWRMRDIQRGLL